MGPAAPVNVKTTHGRPARAAYAATAAPALPDDDEAMTRAPRRRALEIATVARRSLNDHVGLRDSSFT